MRRAELLIRYWLPAVAWSAVLLALSGSAGSSGITARVLAVFVPPSSTLFDTIHYAVRKTIHVLAYATAGALDFRAVRGARPGWTLRWSVAAVLLAAVIASLDEFHQSFVPGRTSSPLDVLLDCCGATLAQIVLRRLASV